MPFLTSLVSAVSALLLLVSSSSAQVINGCIKLNGTLKVTVTPGVCGMNETPISWNVQGPPGVPGMDGIDGEPGETGPEGPPGPTLSVFDGTGAELGLLIGLEAPVDSLLVYLQGIGAYTRISTVSGQLLDDTNNILYFEGAGCTGQAYLETQANRSASRLVTPVIEGTERYFVGGNQHVGVVAVESQVSFAHAAANSVCGGPTSTSAVGAVLAEELQIGDLGLPLPLALPIYPAPSP